MPPATRCCRRMNAWSLKTAYWPSAWNFCAALMSEAGLDMWVVVNREYAEDPVYFTLVPQPSFAARRTTMLVFSRAADGTVERLAVNRYPLGGPYKSAWAGGDLDAQWKALGALIASREPKRIGINVSRTWPAADGLTHALHERLVEVLPPGYAGRLVSAEALVVRWIETRTPAEQALYPHINSIARGVIAEAFSGRVITPGVTTTDEVAWYIRERFESLGLRPWFMATVDRQRAGQPCPVGGAGGHCGDEGRIEAGDVLHTDVGFCYLKLCTDTQEMGYVLKAGEEGVPPGLKAALGRRQSLAGHTDRLIPGGAFRQRDPRGNDQGLHGSGPCLQHLQPSPGILRAFAGADDRHVGQPGADAGNGRLPAASGYGLRNRGQRGRVASGVGRAARAGHAGAGRAVRRQRRTLPRRAPDGLAPHSLASLVAHVVPTGAGSQFEVTAKPTAVFGRSQSRLAETILPSADSKIRHRLVPRSRCTSYWSQPPLPTPRNSIDRNAPRYSARGCNRGNCRLTSCSSWELISS